MKAMRQILRVLVLSMLILLAGCNGNQEVNEYGYRFYESTGPNQYIILEGREVPIKNFVPDASNPVALKSLRAPKWSVLYANSEGDKIILSGQYDRQAQSFHLIHWYIKAPFERLVVEDETRVPHNINRVISQSLERTDFETRNGFDPNDPAFDPKSFQRVQ